MKAPLHWQDSTWHRILPVETMAAIVLIDYATRNGD